MRALRDRAAITAVTTLAFSISLALVAQAVIVAVLFQPFIFPRPEELVLVWSTQGNQSKRAVAGPDLADWRQRVSNLTHLDAYIPNVPVAADLGTGSLRAAQVGPDVLAALGVRPVMGRLPAAADVGTSRAVLSYALWRDAFGGGDVLDKTIRLNGVPHAVIGVMPPRFSFPDDRTQVWVPLPDFSEAKSRGVPLYQVVGRLRPGASIDVANAELQALTRALAEAYPSTNASRGVALYPFVRVAVENYERATWSFAAAALILLLVGCANVSILLAGRVALEQKEWAIRRALGAPAYVIFAELVLRALLFAAVAAALAIAGAYWLLEVLRGLDLRDVPGLIRARLQLSTLVTAILLAAATAVASSLIPWIRVRRLGISESLKLGGSNSRSGTRPEIRRLIVGAQAMLGMVLVSFGAVMLQDFVTTAGSSWGFDSDDLLLVETRLPPRDLRNVAAQEEFAERAVDALSTVPGVTTAAMAFGVPVRWSEWTATNLAVEGRLVTTDWHAGMWKVSRNYFSAMGIPLLAGREFSKGDDATQPRVTILSDSLARKLWPSESAVGKSLDLLHLKGAATNTVAPELARRVRRKDPSLKADLSAWERAAGTSWVVIGVVADVRMFGLDVVPAPALYIDHRQQFRPLYSYGGATPQFVLRVDRFSPALTRHVRERLTGLKPDLTFGDTVPMVEVVSRELGSRGFKRLLLLVFSVFGTVAIVILACGTYASVRQVILERREEVVIRSALGAPRRSLALGLLLEILTAAAAGGALGAGVAFGVLQLYGHVVPQVPGLRPSIVGASFATIVIVAAFATWLPAYRAASVNPAESRRFLLH